MSLAQSIDDLYKIKHNERTGRDEGLFFKGNVPL